MISDRTLLRRLCASPEIGDIDRRYFAQIKEWLDGSPSRKVSDRQRGKLTRMYGRIVLLRETGESAFGDPLLQEKIRYDAPDRRIASRARGTSRRPTP